MHDIKIREIEKSESEICKRCGRKLKSASSRELGYGPSCFARETASVGIVKLDLWGETIESNN